MKNFKNYLAGFAMFALLFSSCSKDETATDTPSEDVAVLTLGADLSDFKTNDKQTIPDCMDSEPAYAVITFSYGDVVREDVEIEILQDEDGWFTAYHSLLEIPVTSGDHVSVTLHDFSVFDADDNPIWVSPREGSEFASFVTQPVGDGFVISLRAGSKNYTDVEVLCYDEREVNKYGYQFFDIIPGELQPLCFFANYCPTGEDGRDRVADYVLNLYHYTGTPEAVPNPAGPGYIELYSDDVLSPDQGLEDGVFYADPLCRPIPTLDEGEYIYYEATLASWTNNYPAPGNVVMSGYLDQDDIDILLGDDEDTVDYVHLRFNCDNDGPPSGDCPAGQDPDGDGICGPDDDCPNVHTDDDDDGDCIPNDDDDCPYDPTNDCDGNEVGEGCETAYMFGDTELNDLDYNGNNWGWGLIVDGDDFDDEYMVSEGVWRLPFYAGAGQNDITKGWEAGFIVLTLDGDMLDVEIDLNDGVTINDTHIWVSNDWPESRAPGQFDMNDADNSFEVGEGDIYVIVHAEVCGDEED